MKKHPRNTRNHIQNTSARGAAIVLVAIASFLWFAPAVWTQRPTPTPPPTPWPVQAPFKPAIDAFTKVLTEAGRNQAFRDKLKLSCDSARDTVASFTNMKIPNNVFIIFYEGEVIPVPTPTSTSTPKITVTPTPNPSRQNERMHVFVLPPFNEHQSLGTVYKYEDYLMCCYQYWTS
jgi:hypothetical protein